MAGTVPRMAPADLAARLLGAEKDKIAIVDVRDDDHIGGHIQSSIHLPSRTINAFMPDLVHNMRGKEVVVFHCALSQQRGPDAAGRYMRARERVVDEKPIERNGEEKPVEQRVYVLDRGFVGWQEVYGEDERLTEGFSRAIWKEGYWM